MSHPRRSYGKLNHMPAWGIFKDGKIVGSCKAANELDAQQVFLIHNQRHPELAIVGEELRKIP